MVGKNNLGKSIGVTLTSILVIVLLAWIVVAALSDIGANLKVRAPVTGGNYSSMNHTGNIPTLFNVSFLNASIPGEGDIINVTLEGLNVTFLINFTSDWVVVGNSTTCVTYNGDGKDTAGNMSCWGYLNVTGNGTGAGRGLHADGYYTVNASINNGTNTGVTPFLQTIIGTGSGVNMTTILIDNNGPFNVNITGLSSGNNHSTNSLSGNLTLNVSVADTTTLINHVIFQVINSTGHQNGTIIGAQEGTGHYWSSSLNTTHFQDGNYSIVIFVNDTAGNFNGTTNNTAFAPLSSLFFDNTAPSISHSCTPTTVNTGDVVTCSCSGSATSGVNSTSFTVNPDTTSTGLFSTKCAVVSKSGLAGSLNAQYTVEQSGGGSSSGGGGGGGSGSSSGGDTTEEDNVVEEGDEDFIETTWTETIAGDDADFSEKVAISQELGEKSRVSIKLEGETHHVGVVSISRSSAIIEIASTPKQVELNVGESKKFELTGDGFYDMKVSLVSLTGSKANVNIEYLHEEISPAESGMSIGMIIGIIIAIIIILGIVFYVRRKN